MTFLFPRELFKSLRVIVEKCLFIWSAYLDVEGAWPPLPHMRGLAAPSALRSRSQRRRRLGCQQMMKMLLPPLSAAFWGPVRGGRTWGVRGAASARTGGWDARLTMRAAGMDLLWRILAAFSFDCFRSDSSSSRWAFVPEHSRLSRGFYKEISEIFCFLQIRISPDNPAR